MTCGVIGGAIFQWPLGLLSDRLDRRRVLAGIALGACVIGAAIGLTAATMPKIALMLLGGLWGGMAFPLYSVAVALTNDHARTDEYVQVSSGLLLLYGFGAVAGPLLAAMMMGAIGSKGLYVFSAAVHLCLFTYVGLRARKRLPELIQHRSGFGDALTGVQTASAVYGPDDETGDIPKPS